jgi:putative ABC transport system permease protein
MIAHYLTTALARIAKAPFTAAASVLTLALGLACFIAAYGIAAFLQSGDGFHAGAERLYYISRESGETSSPPPLAAALRDEMPELEAVGWLAPALETAVSTGRSKAFLATATADPELFDLFTFDFVEGGPATALRAPNEVVLTADAATRLFGGEPALGSAVRIDGQRDATVAGVIATPRRSFMSLSRFDMLAHESLSSGDPAALQRWNLSWGFTVVRLPPAMSLETFEARLAGLAARRVPVGLDGRPSYALQAFPIRVLMTAGEPVLAAVVPLGLGVLILLVAGGAYANLAAAQGEGRRKESGMRKVLGAGRRELLAQHLLDAGLLVLPAMGLAVLIVVLAAPVMRDTLPGLDPADFLARGPGGALVLAALAAMTALTLAIYPTLAAARVRTADALGAGEARAGAGMVARILVGVQFFIVSLLVIVVTAVQLQLAHARTAALDPADDPVVVLDDLERSGVDFETLAGELRGAPQIRAMTATSWAPWTGITASLFVGASGDAGTPGVRAVTMSTGADYLETYGVGLLAGRGFDPARDSGGAGPYGPPGSGPATILLDERLAASLGFPTPEAAVGATIVMRVNPADPDPVPSTPLGVVVGVTETDRAYNLRAGEHAGVLITFDAAYEQARTPAIRLDPRDVPGGLAAIERAWTALAPDVPLRARFLDDVFDEATVWIRTASDVFVVLSLCALLISATGLLGIAVYVAARRRREMGIRKTLGATTLRLAWLLLVDFSRPVLVANLLAWPVGYLVAQLFLQGMSDRIALTPATFLVSTALTLLIACAAVMGEVWKAASVRPAEVLRHA